MDHPLENFIGNSDERICVNGRKPKHLSDGYMGKPYRQSNTHHESFFSSSEGQIIPATPSARAKIPEEIIK